MEMLETLFFFFFSSRRRHTRYWRDWSSDVCSSDLRRRQGREVRDHSWVPEGFRWCPSCRQAVAHEDFTRSARTSSGFGSHCKPCKYAAEDRKSTRLNSSHANISYAVFCLKKKKENQ